MPTDRELENAALLRQFQGRDMSGVPTPSLSDLSNYIERLRNNVPDAQSDRLIEPTPITPAIKGIPNVTLKKPPSTEQTQGELYLTVEDKSGNLVTLFSNTGELKGPADFAAALKQYNSGKGTPEGFTARPFGSGQEVATRGLVTATREKLPQAGETVGSIAALSPLLLLAAKAGLISPNTPGSAISTGRAVGRNVADFVGQQVDTPGELGLATGTGVASKLALPLVGGSGELLKINLLKNILGTGAAGVAGSTLAKTAMGETQTPEKFTEEFATAALANGVQGVASYWLTRILKPATATKVATEMMDAIKRKYPTLINDENAFNIANASPKDISALTSMMSKALRGDATDEATELITNIKLKLPNTPTVAQQNTLRAHARRIIDAQTKALDNIGDDVEFNAALPLIQQRKGELLQAVRDIYPNVKNIQPTIVRVEEALLKHSDFVDTFREGAQVLHYLKKSGAGEKFDPMQFAQSIRGKYEEDPNSLLNEVGRILGQGRSLKELPAPGEAEPGGEFARRAFNALRHVLPGAERWTEPLKYKGPPVPWPTPPRTGVQAPLPSFAAQQAGQAAIRSFLSKDENK